MVQGIHFWSCGRTSAHGPPSNGAALFHPAGGWGRPWNNYSPKGVITMLVFIHIAPFSDEVMRRLKAIRYMSWA